MRCADLTAHGDTSVVQTLTSVDCHLNGAVSQSYARLFGEAGQFGAVLTTLLTIFVAWIAYGLITGRGQLSLRTMSPKMLTLCLVVTFATAWPAYQAVVFGLLTGGPDQIATALTGAPGGAARAFAVRLDQLFNSVVDIGREIDAGRGEDPVLEQASGLIWSSAMILLISTLGLLVISRIVLTLLLAIGPIFIVLALFDSTRPLFEGWLKTSIAFAVAPALTVIGGVVALNLISPLIEDIGRDPLAAARDLRPLISLLVLAMIYAGTLIALAWAAFNLSRDFRLRRQHSEATERSSPSSPATDTVFGGAGDPAAGDVRVASIISAAALTSASAAPGPGDLRVPPAVIDLHQQPTASTTRASRQTASGLGQQFRPKASRRLLTGAPG